MASQVGDGLCSDPSEIIKTSLPDVPSDLALNRYNIPTTYTTLQDVLDNARASEHSQTPRSTRHDSHQPLFNTDELDDFEQSSEAIVQNGESTSTSYEDDGSHLEINFKGLSTDSTDSSIPPDTPRRGRTRQHTPNSGEFIQVDGSCLSRNVMTNGIQNVLDNLTPTGCSGSESSDSENSPCGHKRKKLRPSRKHLQSDSTKVITPAVQDVLDNLTTDGCSGSDYWESEDEDFHLVRKPLRDTNQTHTLQNTEASQSYPSMPPEPELKPLAFDHSSIPSYPLDGTVKRHVRARTYPLRIHPDHQLTAADHENQNQNQSQKTTTQHTARRFTSFDNLPAPKIPPHPPKPTARIQLHRHPSSQVHPALLPLPHRPSNPPPLLNPQQDAFYHALKSKLWALARELETLAPDDERKSEVPEAPSPDLDDDEVSVVFKLDREEEEAEREAASDGDVDTNTSNSGSGSDEEGYEDEDTNSENTIRHPTLSATGKHKTGTRRRISRPRADVHEPSDAGTASDSLCGSDVDELVNWVRAKPALECLQRRRSEGRGRQRARERAASLRERWLRAGPD
ncbi:uncharacterized protein BDZ99DRAFT_192695 [Mytilinidion resinicola]|uniref:Uncharacterized protein n=1 Tax=Mytilinidion resinicola TaxID=574789 RepID=A0A6A6Z236_9PEZI|nr:uncharacterized protein BDZ99DRAFT_192695 [Mytilinidion resinicola]KAF2815232.1 hypothetical protein BDZ99DRAFT_192695 [Mytilinidion resinicola]